MKTTKVLDDNLFDPQLDPQLKGEFQFYKSFHSLDNANEYITLFKKYNIPYLIDAPQTIIDKAIVGHGLMPSAVIKLLPKDFKRINKIVRESLLDSNQDLSDHYLALLDNEELLAIFSKPDEWSIEDETIAQKILHQRGYDISQAEIDHLKSERLAKIRLGRKAKPLTISLYFLGIITGFIFHWIFIIAGLGMGYYYAYDKSVDQEGEQYFTFEPNTRENGKWMLIVGIFILFVQIAIGIMLVY